MDIASFLKTVVTTSEGYFNLSIGRPDGSGWDNEWYTWPHDLDKIVTRAEEASPNLNVYFSSHLFEIKDAHKTNVLPSATIQADLDDAIVPTVNPPTVLVETSPNRHQGYWILQDALQPDILESMSQQITYGIADADRSGWSLGHKMRLPGTLNHKYSTGPKQVKVISANVQVYRNLKLGTKLLEAEEPSTNDWEPTPLEGTGPRELWNEIKPTLPRRVQAQYDHRQPDRSVTLWTLTLSLFRAGLDRNQVFWLARESANNKFKDNKYHADLDLAKDILRAERAIRKGDDNTEDIRLKIMDARRLPGLAAERRQYIAGIVRDTLSKHGAFVASTDGQEWFVREDTGRPIPLTRNNDYLNALLEMRFSLNATEPEQRYSINHLISTTKERGQPGVLASLSHYDRGQQLILVHTGRRDVLRIDKNGVTTIANGNLNVLFPWKQTEEPFQPDIENPISIDTMFEGCFNNLNEMPSEEGLALIKAWFYFLFFRNDATGRPILALFGQPGSGKSTLCRRIYTILYGTSKAVNSITSADDYDHAVANDPLVVFDNVDTWVSWLPDKLALSASTSDLVKRKLYTDNDTVTLKRQALIGITAHNPKFRREDIVDRLVILSFHRLARFDPETEMLQNIYMNRDRLWGGIVRDLQRILGTPPPIESELPKFRISDFARIGLWVARALGFEQDFLSALTRNIKEQTSFNLEEEDILVETIKTWVLRPGHNENKLWTVGELWTQWSAHSRDPQNFIRMYRNAVTLGKKLWTLQETLSSVLNIEFYYDKSGGGRLWRISAK